MLATFFIMAIILQQVCKGQEKCEVFPKNQVVRYGSNLTLSFRAPPSSECHRLSSFTLSRVTWRLNNETITQSFSNSTVTSVFIQNFSMFKGTVECLWNNIVLDGTIIYLLPSRPQNVSCIMKGNTEKVLFSLTCTWDHDQHGLNTQYRVHMKQKDQVWYCWSSEKFCPFKYTIGPMLDEQLIITVIAENSAGNVNSDEVIYDFWSIVQYDPPAEIKVKPELNSLRITWTFGNVQNDETCEVHSEPAGENVKHVSKNTYELTGVKPCTNYTISVRCRHPDTLWSTWSPTVTALSLLNVSNEPFHLWRTSSLLHSNNRAVHLMWKGISPSCNAFDEYRVSVQTPNSNSSRHFGPFENHTFITLDDNAHRITLAVFREDENLRELSIEIPATAEDIRLPPVGNVSMFAQDHHIHISWNKPDRPVSGYIITWNNTEKNHKWLHTQETQFSLKGQDCVLYTISLTPLYENGPGDEIRLLNYAQEGEPAPVSDIASERITDQKAEVHWQPVLTTQSCAFIVSYTVFYEAQGDPEPKNVTVDHNQHSIILHDLQPKTSYTVYIQSNSMAASSKRSIYHFSTKSYDETLLIVLCVCIIGLMLVIVFIVLIRKRYLNEKVPNPQFSSLSLWSSQKCRNQWSQLPLPLDWDSEKVLTCQLETDDHSISARDVTNLKASTADQNTATQETTRTETGNADLVNCSTEIKHASDAKEERTQLFLPVDLQTPQIHPVHASTPYRNQTPVTSPVDSPRKVLQLTAKPCSSEETETLLKPKHRNTTLFTTYVTVDMIEQGKGQSK